MTTEVFERVWDALEKMKLRSSLLIAIAEAVSAWHVTQMEAARRLGVTPPRLSDLLRGRIGKFSLDALVPLAARAVFQCIWKSRWPLSVPGDSGGMRCAVPPYACCWTLLDFGGRFFLFRVSKIAFAVFGSLSRTTLVSGGFIKYFSNVKLAGIWVRPSISVRSELKEASGAEAPYHVGRYVFLYAGGPPRGGSAACRD